MTTPIFERSLSLFTERPVTKPVIPKVQFPVESKVPLQSTVLAGIGFCLQHSVHDAVADDLRNIQTNVCVSAEVMQMQEPAVVFILTHLMGIPPDGLKSEQDPRFYRACEMLSLLDQGLEHVYDWSTTHGLDQEESNKRQGVYMFIAAATLDLNLADRNAQASIINNALFLIDDHLDKKQYLQHSNLPQAHLMILDSIVRTPMAGLYEDTAIGNLTDKALDIGIKAGQYSTCLHFLDGLNKEQFGLLMNNFPALSEKLSYLFESVSSSALVTDEQLDIMAGLVEFMPSEIDEGRAVYKSILSLADRLRNTDTVEDNNLILSVAAYLLVARNYLNGFEEKKFNEAVDGDHLGLFFTDRVQETTVPSNGRRNLSDGIYKMLEEILSKKVTSKTLLDCVTKAVEFEMENPLSYNYIFNFARRLQSDPAFLWAYTLGKDNSPLWLELYKRAGDKRQLTLELMQDYKDSQISLNFVTDLNHIAPEEAKFIKAKLKVKRPNT